MQQAGGAGGEVHESAERRGLDDLAVVGFAGFRNVRVGDLVDDLLGLFGGLSTFGGDVDGTVVLDGDLGAGVLLDLVDHLALRADDLAALVHRNGGGDDARSELAHLGRAVDALVDDFEDGGAGFLGLLQGSGKNVCRTAVQLGVELQGGDEFGGAGHLEVHVAEGVFGAEDVGERLVDVLAVDVAGLDCGEIAAALICAAIVLTGRRKNIRTTRHPGIEVKQIIKTSIPVSLNRLALHGMQSLEAALIPLMLTVYGYSAQHSVAIFGILPGMAMPVILFPST